MNNKAKNPVGKIIVLKLAVFIALMAGMYGLTKIPFGAPKDTGTIVYLVRHAEKITGENAGRDPQLTEAGKLRAQVLAELLRDKNIGFVHSTDYIRTRDTAAPLAKIAGADIKIYNPQDLDTLANHIKALGGRHLVVGHSNTTQETAVALGSKTTAPPINEAAEYDRLYKVQINDEGVHTILSRYGARYTPAE